MTDQVGDEKFQPPYMAWATFESIIENLSAQGLPDQIDRSLLRNRSGGDQAQFLRAARSFGLINAQGEPLDRFKTYVTEPDKRRDILRQILTECYPNVVSLGNGATPAQLTNAFRTFGIDGDTVRKAETFYLNAARQAEIEVSPHFKATRSSSSVRRRTPRTPARPGKIVEHEQSHNDPGPSSELSLHPAILTLVQALPSTDEAKPEFPTSEREAWFAYAKATFNLIYTLPDNERGG